MASLTQEAGGVAGTTVLSSDLDALANNAGSALSAAVNQDTNLDLFGQCELSVDFVSAPTAESAVEVYAVPALDGTNYADYTSGASPVASLNHYAGSFVLKATTAAQRVTTRPFSLPGCDFKLAVINKSGQAFPASGSTVKLWTFKLKSA